MWEARRIRLGGTSNPFWHVDGYFFRKGMWTRDVLHMKQEKGSKAPVGIDVYLM